MSNPSFHRRYFAQLSVYQILIVIQVMLVILSFRQFKAKRINKQILIKWMYISVMCLGTLTFLVVEWYGLADFLYDFAAYPLYCTSAAVLGATLLITYLFALYLFYLVRLYKTFAQSSYAMSPCHLKLLIVISLTVYIVLIVIVFVYQRSEPIQILFAWSGRTADYKPIIICKGEFSIGLDIHIRIAMQVIIVIGNTFYGWLFWYKLQQIIKGMTDGSNTSSSIIHHSNAFVLQLYKVVKKQTILVLLSTISTLLLWSAANVLYFYGSFLQIFVYIDISINCLCLWLMFGWNDAIYDKYCVCAHVVSATIFKCLKTEGMEAISEFKKEGSTAHTSATATATTTVTLDVKNSPKGEVKETPPSTQSLEIINRNLEVIMLDINA
eukprot:40350_1